jgi:hypothetical protein
MESPTGTAAAPAPETVSAAHAAVIAGDPGQYREAKRAERAGKPLEPVVVSKESPPAQQAGEKPAQASAEEGPAPKFLSSKERHRLAENERIRQAVEEGITQRLADARKTWDAEHPAAKPVEPIVVERAEPVVPLEPPKNFDEAIQRPDLTKPLLTEEQFFHAYPDAPYSAYARYASHYDLQARSQEDRRRADHAAILTAHKAQIDGFVGKLKAAAAADPTFTPSLSDRVKMQLKPFAALARDANGNVTEASGPINVIGEQVYASDLAPQMLRHFSAHPEDLDRLIAVPAHLASLPPALRTARHINWMLQEYGKLEATIGHPAAAAVAPTPTPPSIKTISDASAPARVLTGHSSEAIDPKVAAIRAGQAGTAAYREIRREERAAQLGLR